MLKYQERHKHEYMQFLDYLVPVFYLLRLLAEHSSHKLVLDLKPQLAHH